MKNIALLLFLLPTILIGQDIDMDRMNRDIKVAENGLKTLIQGNNGSTYFTSGQNNLFHFSSRNVEGQYIKDYGVVFTAEICEPCYTNRNKNKNKDKDSESTEGLTAHLTDAAKTFLADYGSIIGQLGSDQKIMIRYTDEGGNNSFPRSLVVTDGDGKKNSAWVTESQSNYQVARGTLIGRVSNKASSQEITVEVAATDLKASMVGNLSRDALIAKIKVESQTVSFEDDPRLETFSAMFHRLYQKDLSSTYFMSSRPNYSKIQGVGTMFKARVYSSNVFDNERYSIPTRGEKDLSLEERNSVVVDMLPEFEKVFKENMVSYARTIRDMDKNESILFEVRMTECKGCYEFPKYINFSVKQEVLDQFNKGKLSFEQAVGKVSVERRGA